MPRQRWQGALARQPGSKETFLLSQFFFDQYALLSSCRVIFGASQSEAI